MFKVFKLSATLLLVVVFLACKQGELSRWEGDFKLSIMSFNLRFDTEEDGNNRWDNRKHACLKMFKEQQPFLFCIQEGLHHQVTFLKDSLPAYDYVGVGRDDGQTSGEYSAVFYMKERFELLDNGNFWLSETPNEPSLGWDANNIRIVTWAQLKDVQSSEELFVFNTHFDHKGKTARKESGKLLVKKIEELVGEHKRVYITGDFNAQIGNSIMHPIIDKYYGARRFALRSDNVKSFNAWGRWYLNRNIDFIFYSHGSAQSFSTVSKSYGVPYISDHYPIIAHFE